MRPSWAQRLPWDIITDQARRTSMEPALIAAVIQKESSGIQWQTRFEKNWKWFVTPGEFANLHAESLGTEITHQMTSWGLMQIMGGTARGVGFRGYFPQLCASPALGIHYGAMYLKSRIARTRTLEEAVATYNAGPGELLDGKIDNRAYVDEVLANYRALTG